MKDIVSLSYRLLLSKSGVFDNFVQKLTTTTDEIWVEHRVQPSPKITETPVLISNGFSKQFRVLLDKSPHSDITFIVGEEKEEFYMHKAILSARSSYFEAMFRPGGMSESSKAEIEIGRHDKDSFRRMMEFIYTAEILHLEDCTSAEIISLLEISHQYLLDDLASIAEAAACKIVKQDNIGKFMLLCATYNTLLLRDVCKRFVSVHGTKLRQVYNLPSSDPILILLKTISFSQPYATLIARICVIVSNI